MRCLLLATTALMSVGSSGSAFAQTAAPADSGIGDIVVTARRVSENLQSVALAIDAVSGKNLAQAGVTNAYELTKLVPALSINSSAGSNTSLFLRGVGNRTNSSYADPAIAISYDGVFMGRTSGAFGASFYDLERVEVLKGPQGILYGRNATGGAVNVIPVKPRLGVVEGYGSLSYGNYNAFEAQGAINLPLGDKTALRVAGTRVSRDGFNRDGTSDADSYGLRGQLLFQPSDTVSVRIGGDYTKFGGIGAGSTYEGNYVPNGTGGYAYIPSGLDENEGMYTAAANAYRRTLLLAPGFGFATAMQDKPYQDYKYIGFNAEINVQTGIGTLTVIPAWRKTQGSSVWGVPSFNSGWMDETDTQTSLEARLASEKSNKLAYVAGAYYINEKIVADNTYNQEFVLPLQEYTQKTRSYALFGQLTYNATDRFRLVGGLRYTNDHKSMDGIINNFITFCGGIPPTTPPASFGIGCQVPGALPHFPTLDNPAQTVAWLIANNWIPANSTLQPNVQVFPLLTGKGLILKTHNPVVDSGSQDRVTWKASAEYDVAADSMLYATVETGYHSGGYQLAEGNPKYNPEYITSYTIGSKNRFMDNKLQANIEAFYWKYRDQQITYFSLDATGVLINQTQNVGRSTMKGFDLDLIYAPVRNTRINAKVQYLDAKYQDLHFITAAPRDNFGCPFTFTGASSGGAPVKDFNCSGKQSVYAPKWTLNFGIDQTVPLSSSFDLVASLNTAWRDDAQGGFEYLPTQVIKAYWTSDFSLTLRDNDRKWSLTGFVRNIEDNRHRDNPIAAPTGQAVTIFSAPRTYGARLQYNF